jgi:colanic acid biosynthesis protein WcaH
MSEISLELYKQIHASVPIACVDAVLMLDNKILLGRRTNKPAQGQYWLPGGRVLKGETRVKAIHRKIKEETGLEINILAELGTDETLFPDGPFGGPTHTINTVFLAEPSGAGTLVADAQNNNFEWFAILPGNLHSFVKKYCTISLAR